MVFCDLKNNVKDKTQEQAASDVIGAGRVVCGVQYDGSSYHGWQKQNSGVSSVQAVVEGALSSIANETIEIVCAGRTDAKVHATGQVVHFDTTATRPEDAWIKGVNSKLPSGVAVDWVKATSHDFHARFSATARRYRYLIYNNSIKPAHLNNLLTWSHWNLDEEKMHEAAQYLLGELDFSSFRAAQCQSNTPYRNIHFINVTRKNNLIEIDIQANAFLHHMVRNIVGVLMHVGCGRAPVGWVEEVLFAKNRCEAAITAPPFGLYLVDVNYPIEYSLPKKECGPFFINI